MKYLQRILLFMAICSVVGSCGNITLNENCTEGEELCENDVLYRCVKENKYKFLKVKATCIKGCDLNNSKRCKPSDDCPSEQFKLDGSCDMGCLFGTNNDGSCINTTNCATQTWNSDGSCQCPEECEDSCNEAGVCNTKQCSNGYNSDGSCLCPEECSSGCTEEGECKCPDGCQNGCDEEWKTCCDKNCNYGCSTDGKCLCDSSCSPCNLNGDCCPRNCVHGCDSSLKCLCNEICLFGCDEDGNCIKDTQCKYGWNEDGSCSCPDTCEFGCLTNGSCYDESSCEDDKACEDVDYCKNSECYCNDANKCKLKDANHNHLMDSVEVGSQLGKSCRVDEDCGENGFCDSFMNYICSTRCTQDSQCVDNAADDFHYICRPDGRCAPDAFVTVWTIEDENATVQLPISDKCKFHINWGDGQEDDIANCDNSMALQHTYSSPNQYTITLSKPSSGKFEYNKFSLCKLASNNTSYEPINQNVNSLLTGVLAFGPIGLGPGAFCACSNLTQLSTVDIPDASQLTSMHGMFSFSDFNRNIENWDVSHVKNMRFLFQSNPKFNHPLNHWNVSNVTNMIGVFAHATSFDQPLNDWNVSKVTDMNVMFYDAAIFNQPLNKWDVSNVKTMTKMFQSAKKFNQNINSWNTSSLTDINLIFANAINYNQPLNGWDVSNVTNMSGAFYMAIKFNQELKDWDVSKVTNMSSMFRGAVNFNRPLNSWNVSNVTNMELMFSNRGRNTDGFLNKGHTSKFNQPLNKWKVSKVTNMKSMFETAESFNQNLADWKVKSATITSIFLRATKMSRDNYCKIHKAWTKKPSAPSSDKRYKNCPK